MVTAIGSNMGKGNLKSILIRCGLAGSFIIVAAAPLSAMLGCAHPSTIQQTGADSEDPYQQILRLAAQARIALRDGREAEARNLLQAAIKLAPKDDVTTAAIYNLVGNVLASEAYYQLAISHYERGLEVLSGSPDPDFKVVKQALQDLSSWPKRIRASRGAFSPDLEPIEIADLRALRQRPTGLKELAATLLINDGSVYFEQQQLRQAEGLYERALQAADSPSLEALRRRVYSNLAWSAIQQRQTDKADKLLASALKDVPPSLASVELRGALLVVAVSLRERQKYSEAIKRFEQVLLLYRAANDMKGLSRAKAHLAAAQLAAGDAARAKALLTEVVNDSSQSLDPESERYVHATLAQANRSLGDLPSALRHFQIYLDRIESISSRLSTEEGVLSFRETQGEFLDDYIRTALALAVKEKNYVVAREAIEKIRARSLFSLAQARSSWHSPTPGQIGARSLLYDGIARYEYQEAPGELVTEARPRSNQAKPNSVLQVAPAVAASENLGECPETSPGESKGSEQSSGKYSEATNSPPVTFLEYYVLKEQTIAIVKNRESQVFGVSLPIGETQLTSLVDEYVRTLDVANRRGVKIVKEINSSTPSRSNTGMRSEQQIAQELYALLIRPVRRFLPSDTDHPVVIVPHRALWYLPFAALAPQKGTRMIDELLVTYANSEATWRLAVSRPRTYTHLTARAWVVGNPTVSGRVNVCGSDFEFADLPGAKKEAEEIAGLFGKGRAELFTGDQGDRLRLEAWYGQFGVIHLAAHGIACPDQPFDSSIMLARVDGAGVKINGSPATLTVDADNRFSIKLCGLPLKEFERPTYFTGGLPASAVVSRYQLNADLVTLSACQTGLGATLGEGMIGFTRAFQAAGARTLVVSLWNVSDEATRRLMVEFYGEYLKQGNKAVALRKAMLATRQRYPEPRLWAAFSLFGAPE
jgi:CHAT domain-containing protein/Tfp pilus assembly protein PilF